MAKRVSLIWLVGVAVAALIVGAVVAYTRAQPLAVSVAAIEKDVPIQVFGLGTIEAQTGSRIGFETAGTLVS